ncbi:MAG: hypothetical protein J5755_01130, partial [Clostridia bacterium]|nr:hypothetical protein [Clostridia bacterium]
CVVLCAVALVACKEGQLTTTNVPIETAKAGKIKIVLYDKADIAQDKASLTKLVHTEEASIVDDGRGLYLVSLSAEGQGTATIDDAKVLAGSTVTVRVTPDAEWAFDYLVVDEIRVDGTSFVMPDHPVSAKAYFRYLRHGFSCTGGIHLEGEELLAQYDYKALEGERLYFTVDLDNVSRYYEDEDVYCRSRVWTGEEWITQDFDVRKESEGRYSIVVPPCDFEIGVNSRECACIRENIWLTVDGDGIADDYSAYCSINITIGGQPFEFGQYYHAGELVVEVIPTAGYYVDEVRIRMHGETWRTTKKDATHFSILLDAWRQYIQVILKSGDDPGTGYLISVGDCVDGSVQVDKARADEGETVTVTVTPDEGYALATLQYSLDGEWYDIALSDMGEYEFFMPEGDVTIKATFRDSSQPPASGLRVYVQTPEYGDELVLTEVISYIVLIADDEVIPNIQIADDMTLPVEAGQWSLLEVGLKEGYELLGIYYHNDSVMVSNYGRYGAAEFEVGENDPDGGAIIVVVAW